MEAYIYTMTFEHWLMLGVEALGLLSMGIAAYVGMKSEITKLKSRIHVLEMSETKIQSTLETLVQGIQEIKLLLAKRGIE